MKTHLSLFAIGGSLLLASPMLPAQTTNTNSLPLNQTVRYQVALANDRSLGELALLPPGLKEKMRLTDDQRAELKPIEDDFAKTSQEYQTANQPYRDSAVKQIEPLLTPDQIVILEDPNNQWHESHPTEANDPSAN